MSKLKVGDIVSYEPMPKWTEAQVMWGSLGVVRELIPDYEFDGEIIDCLRLNWLHRPVDAHWNEMIIDEENCRKVGEVNGDTV